MLLPRLVFNINLGKGLKMPQRVFVRAYTRLRFGALEFVTSHTRGWPNQLSFNF